MKRLLIMSAVAGMMAISSSAWAGADTQPAVEATDHPAASANQVEYRWERQNRPHYRFGLRSSRVRVAVQPEVEPQAVVDYRWETEQRFNPRRGNRIHWVRVPTQSD